MASRLAADLVASVYEKHLKGNVCGELLDLGCGKVPLHEAYKNFISSSVCVDWGNSLHKNDYLDIEHDLTTPLPFADGIFDTIILSDVLEHIPEPSRLFLEISRVLAPSGKVLLNVPFFYWLHEEPHDYYRYTEFALRRFARLSGMKLLHLEAIGGVPEVLGDILAKVCMRLPRIGKNIAAAVQKLAAWFIKTRFGARVSDATKHSFPMGYFLIAQKLDTPPLELPAPNMQ